MRELGLQIGISGSYILSPVWTPRGWRYSLVHRPKGWMSLARYRPSYFTIVK